MRQFGASTAPAAGRTEIGVDFSPAQLEDTLRRTGAWQQPRPLDLARHRGFSSRRLVPEVGGILPACQQAIKTVLIFAELAYP